jgi:hypothetical protein
LTEEDDVHLRNNKKRSLIQIANFFAASSASSRSIQKQKTLNLTRTHTNAGAHLHTVTSKFVLSNFVFCANTKTTDGRYKKKKKHEMHYSCPNNKPKNKEKNTPRPSSLPYPHSPPPTKTLKTKTRKSPKRKRELWWGVFACVQAFCGSGEAKIFKLILGTYLLIIFATFGTRGFFSLKNLTNVQNPFQKGGSFFSPIL